MTEFHDWIAIFSAWWWPKLVDHLWQATLFGLVVWLASFLLKRGPARSRHLLWLLASAKFAVPAALLVLLSQWFGLDDFWLWLNQPGPATNSLLHGISAPAAVLTNNYELTVTANNAHSEIYCAVTGIWLAGCAVLIGSWWSSRSNYRRAVRNSQPSIGGREWLALAQAKQLLGLNRDVRLVLSRQPIEPGVCYVRKPVIVLPESIAANLDDRELLAIMLHELVHVERRDKDRKSVV